MAHIETYSKKYSCVPSAGEETKASSSLGTQGVRRLLQQDAEAAGDLSIKGDRAQC